MGEFLFNHGTEEGVLTMTQNSKKMKEKIDKFDPIKTKNLDFRPRWRHR